MGPVLVGPFADFLARYGDLALMAIIFVASLGAPLPITALLMSLGALSAAPGGPNIVVVAALALAATVAGDAVIYTVGWFGGQPLLRWVRRDPNSRLARRAAQAELALKRYGAPVLFLSRFLFTVIAGPVTLMVGATRLRRRAFVVGDVAGKAVYVLGNLFIGRIFGAELGLRTSGTLFWWSIVAFAVVIPLGTALATRLVRGRLARARLARAEERSS